MKQEAKELHYTKETGYKGKILIFIALIGLALNLRSPLTSLSPIIGELQTDFGISTAVVGLLTTIPILSFGLLTPLASGFIAKMGIETAVMVSILGIALGTMIRPMDGFVSALAGTLVLGMALTVGNIVSLMIITRDFSHRSNSVTGAYTSALNIGTMLTSAFTAPLALFLGWRLAVSSWVVLALFAGIIWGMVFFQSKRIRLEKMGQNEPSVGSTIINRRSMDVKSYVPVWKRKVVWLLVIAFASHLFLYYSITAWLPFYLIDKGNMTTTSAGIAASAFQICALVGALGIPALANTRRFSKTTLLTGVAICWLSLPIGLLLVPNWWLFWALIGGIAQGGGFTIIFMLIVDQSNDIDDNRRISSLVQGIGYSISSAGPIVVGSLYQFFDQWSPSFIILAVVAIILLFISSVIPK